MFKVYQVVTLLVIGIILNDVALAENYSQLWGKNGEKWTPYSRLPDFSFAGYHCGEKPLPTLKVITNVKDFGAKADDEVDDTEAFKKAIEATKEGAILIPKGKYLLSDILWIKKSNIVLRGEGLGKTILHFTNELEDVRPNMGSNTSGKKTSSYSWSGGFLWVEGKETSQKLSTIIGEAKRGDKVLSLSKAADVKPGDWVRVSMTDDKKNSLVKHIYSEDPGSSSKIKKNAMIHFVSRIAGVKGKQVTLERPLRLDIRKDWKPVLASYSNSVSEVGIEELTISFPVKPYKGHFSERGMNGITFKGAWNCWVKNVEILNCDSGIFMGSRFCTIDGLRIASKRAKKVSGLSGHHGVILGTDSLMTNFDIQAKFIHDTCFTNFQSGVVIKNGKGINLAFDHHKRGPYENLLCNIDAGDGKNIWRSGGGRGLGKNSAARGTFWGIRAKKSLKLPPNAFGPISLNFVGLQATEKSVTDLDGKWIEMIPPEKLIPKDLHAAQLARRLKSKLSK
jgi:hypothetical protein